MAACEDALKRRRTKGTASLPMHLRRQIRRYRAQAFYAQKGLCYWCDRPMVIPEQGAAITTDVCTADHVVPQWQGGPHTRENIVAACWGCNQRRGREMQPIPTDAANPFACIEIPAPIHNPAI